MNKIINNDGTINIDYITDYITDAITRGISTIYLGEDGDLWMYQPADMYSYPAIDLAGAACDNNCDITELDAEQIARDLRDGLELTADWE